MHSLVIHGNIKTTEAKAKAVKGLFDRVINIAKDKNSHLLSSYLPNKDVREKLIKDIVPGLKTRTSGYTSLVKLGVRQGDGAMIVQMSVLHSPQETLDKPKVSKVQPKSKKD